MVGEKSFFIDENGNVLDWKNADIINSKIGNIVDGYLASNLEWQVFYSDPIETYLISKTLAKTEFPIPLKREKQSNDEEEYEYKGSADVRKLEYGLKWNKKWLKRCLNNEAIGGSAKATAYMCDPVNWSEYTTEGVANYAVGGPTVEMMIASYNKSQGTNVKLFYEDFTTSGLKADKPEELRVSSSLNWTKNNGVYSTGWQEDYKLATPQDYYGYYLVTINTDRFWTGKINGELL